MTRASRSIAATRGAADDARDAERAFVDDLLDAVASAVEDIQHEVARLRSMAREDDAHAIEVAMRPLHRIHSGVEPDG